MEYLSGSDSEESIDEEPLHFKVSVSTSHPLGRDKVLYYDSHSRVKRIIIQAMEYERVVNEVFLDIHEFLKFQNTLYRIVEDTVHYKIGPNIHLMAFRNLYYLFSMKEGDTYQPIQGVTFVEKEINWLKDAAASLNKMITDTFVFENKESVDEVG